MVRAAPRSSSGTGEVQGEHKTPSVLLSIVPTDEDMEAPAAPTGLSSRSEAAPEAPAVPPAKADATSPDEEAMAKAITEILVEPPADGLAVQETVVTRPELLSGGRSPSTLVPSDDGRAALASTEPLKLPEPSEGLPAPSASLDEPAPARGGMGWLVAMVGGLLLGGGAVSAIALLGLIVAIVGGGAAAFVFLRAAPAPLPTEVAVVVPAADIEDPAAEVPSGTVPATEIAAPVDAAPGSGEAPSGSGTAPAAAPKSAAPAQATPSETASNGGTSTPTPSGGTSGSAPAGGNTGGSAESDAPKPPAPVATTPAPAPAAPVPAPAPASAAASGLILTRILSDPPAAVLTVDGQSKGRTPVKLELEPGTHEITLTAGSSKGTFTIDVSAEDDKFCYGLSGKKVVRTGCP